MHLGFTGTRALTSDMEVLLDSYLTARAGCIVLHHGACQGADEFAHQIAVDNHIPVVVHPPTDTKWEMRDLKEQPGVTIMPRQPYLVRNRAIVNATAMLLAVPAGPEKVRSGTWSTVRYAKKQGKSVYTLCAF